MTRLKRLGYTDAWPQNERRKSQILPKSMQFFARYRPEYVFLIGGKSGGIGANQLYPANLMLDNLLVNCHVIESAHRHGVEKLLYLASSCVYPKFSNQPMRVEYFDYRQAGADQRGLYAIAKLAGLLLPSLPAAISEVIL